MTRICPKCRHERQPNAIAPDWQCPACGVAYAKAIEANPPFRSPRANHRVASTSSASIPWGKLLILMVGLAAGGWWYFQGGRTLSEESVNEFYLQQSTATLARQPAALCNLLASDYQSSVVTFTAGRRILEEANKEQSCEAIKGMYDSFEKLGEEMGGILQLAYHYKIQSISISSDKKTATVETTFTFDVAGSMMNFQGSAVDTLIRRNGKVMLLKTDGQTRVSSG